MQLHSSSTSVQTSARAGAAMPQCILIVEDEDVLARNLKTFLERSACDVRTAADGEQAIRMLDSFRPDALVVDYALPGIDGVRTFVEIARRQAGRIDCVMITGSPSERLLDLARGCGIRHLVCKPFSFAELQQLLEDPRSAGGGDAPEAGL
ncbi:MAG: response regulator [Betaproteobacteria bacterium]|nr:response regulator [Betaproteobacteria bacterium]